ncbi:hypothetical protein HMPREF9440_00798, partial [Sutterella parvirubra YIT 11816]
SKFYFFTVPKPIVPPTGRSPGSPRWNPKEPNRPRARPAGRFVISAPLIFFRGAFA